MQRASVQTGVRALIGWGLWSLLAVGLSPAAWAVTGQGVQERIDADVAAGRPVVVHVVVALCDNVNQGIVPVSETLGNGQDPRTNLYWGALYGLRTHLTRAAGWERLAVTKPPEPRILDRIVLHALVARGADRVPTYIVADAWDGAHIRGALETYLQLAAGQLPAVVPVTQAEQEVALQAGGSAQLVAYVGHDGLMDFTLESTPAAAEGASARSAIVLACLSREYFETPLQRAGAHPLLLTTGLMAPEAYTLDAAIRAWLGEGTTPAVVEAAAAAYHAYQKCGLPGARRLFWGAP